MTDESSVEEGALKKEFSIIRKGYDPAEVQEYLADYDEALRELEDYVARLKHELSEAKTEVAKLRAAEQESVDKAMLAVFDAKERIMERARSKAQEIEEEARVAAGTDPAAAGSTEAADGGPGAVKIDDVQESGSDIDFSVSAQVEPPSLPEEETSSEEQSGPEADKILRQMVSEADVIKTQLEAGMSAAIEEMDRMQQEAEARAAALLEEARTEAIRLRSAGADSKLVGTTLEVTLQEEAGEEEKRSRYSRTSAKLPRLGTEDGPSVLASMNQLRTKLREAEEAERQERRESTAS